MTLKFDNVFLLDSIVLGSELEYFGPIGKYLDKVVKLDNQSFENNEISMLYKAIDMLKEKLNLKDSDINLAISGELSNQLTTTSYTYRNLLIPLIGIYSACSTITLGIGLAALLLTNNEINKILVSTSSNNQSAERQFRNPTEYGAAKEITQTYTATIAAACIISNEISNIKINSFTIGKVIDIGFSNVNDFGRAMAPSAIESLLVHFKNMKSNPCDYDLILTGDLSTYGYEIVKKALQERYGYSKNYNDCGLILYDVKKQNVMAGGSGPGCSAGVLLSYVKRKLLDKEYKKVLICATGALMNPIMINQKNSIPCIAHVIELEGI